MKRFIRWLENKLSNGEPAPQAMLQPPRARIRPAKTGKALQTIISSSQSATATTGCSTKPGGDNNELKPGNKPPVVRHRYVREDTGTHETLKILDDSIFESEEPGGIDPYNTGRFDRSKSWDHLSRK